MKRIRVWLMVLAGVVVLGVQSERARGQAEIEVLIWDSGGAGFAIGAAFALGYTYQSVAIESRFIEKMQQQSWDLVVWELPRVTHTDPRAALQLLDDHIAAGGRAIVNYNDLDSWPELQRLMGVKRAISFNTPKRRVDQADPVHASWGEGGMNWGGDPYGDSGDVLIPAVGSEIAALFSPGEAASLVANSGRTIVSGFDWETYGGSSSYFSQFQMSYLMQCRADFDTSTGFEVLDIFDFLAFQNLFVQQHWKADLRFDGVFDIFDFLDFQQFFMNGCE